MVSTPSLAKLLMRHLCEASPEQHPNGSFTRILYVLNENLTRFRIPKKTLPDPDPFLVSVFEALGLLMRDQKGIKGIESLLCL